MAITVEGRRLTQAHHAAQARLAAETLRDLLVIWPSLDPKAVDATFPTYSRLARALIDERRARSAAIAAQYVRAFRIAEGVAATVPLNVALAEALATDYAMTSLLVTGPVTIKTATRDGKTAEQAANLALSATAGAILRHVHNGGRDTVFRTVERDELALGFARVTDGKPCAWCAMLAGRGPVYKSEASAEHARSGKKFHYKCGCHAEPVYGDARKGYEWPGGDRAKEYADLWQQTEGHGKEAVASFRRLYADSQK